MSSSSRVDGPIAEAALPGRPLSVMLVNSLYAPFVVGGAEVVTEMLARTLAAGGHRVSVVTSCSRDQDVSVERCHDVDIYRFFPNNRWWLYERFGPGDRRSAIGKLAWRFTDAWNRDAGEKFKQILERVQPDVVHTHNIKGLSPILWDVARRKGIPVVHTGHSYELICADGSLLDRRSESCAPSSRCTFCKVHSAWYRMQAAAIDVFCSPSRYLLQAHVEAGVVLKRPSQVLNGVARQVPVRPLSSDRQEEDHPTRYLYMGQLSGHKGIDTLIGAIRLASGASFTIDIAGRGDKEAELRALAEGDGRVRFHGFVEGERKRQLLLDSDVLIFPSIWVENAPMSIAEAFCYGLPVIGSRMGAVPEFVQHAENGLLFEAGSAADLAKCLVQLCAHPDEMRRLKQGASRSGIFWPTPEDMTSDYVGIYRSLL